MGLISFSCASPSASWSPSVNPAFGGGYKHTLTRYQPRDYSDDGSLYTYSKGSKEGRVLHWRYLPHADHTTLMAFLDAMHGVHPFTFTDYDSASYTLCRIVNFQSFDHSYSARNYHDVTLEIEVP